MKKAGREKMQRAGTGAGVDTTTRERRNLERGQKPFSYFTELYFASKFIYL